MVSNKIENLKIKDIVAIIGFPTGIEDVRAAYLYNAEPKKIIEFEKKLGNLSGDYNKLLSLIDEYDEIFDKEIYTFHLAKILEKDINE